MRKREIHMYKVEEQNNPKVEPPYCEKHGQQMVKNGQSKRDLPEFFCKDGTKIEKGKARIKKVLDRKGYGFIKLENGKDLFFHVSNTLNGINHLNRGDWVDFRIGMNPMKKEIEAVKVRKSKNNGRRNK